MDGRNDCCCGLLVFDSSEDAPTFPFSSKSFKLAVLLLLLALLLLLLLSLQSPLS